MQPSQPGGPHACSPAAPPRRSATLIVRRAGHAAAKAEARDGSPLSIADLRRVQLEKNNRQLALSRQRLAAEKSRLKSDLGTEVEANVMLRQTNCQLLARMGKLEERMAKLEALAEQHAQAQLLADREAVAASRAAAAAVAVAATAAAAAAATPTPTPTPAPDSESDASTVVASPAAHDSPARSGPSAAAREVESWLSDDTPQSPVGSAAPSSVVDFDHVTTPTRLRGAEPEPEVDGMNIHSPQELLSPQGHDLSVVPPQGYAARPRRRAALTAATNLHEPGLQSKMTQGMRERKQLRARPGAYEDTWSANAESYMEHKPVAGQKDQ